MRDWDCANRRLSLLLGRKVAFAFAIAGALLCLEAAQTTGLFAGAEESLDVAFTIVASDGKAVTDATVVLLEPGDSVQMRDGEVVDPPLPLPRRPDRSGRWHFRPDAAEFWFVAVHPSGWARVKGTRTSPPKKISLSPWARAEGAFAVARQPRADLDLEIQGDIELQIGKDVAHVNASNRRKTDAHGRFVFERVLPGMRFIGSFPQTPPSAPNKMTPMCRLTVEFSAGQTTRVDFGKVGRRVIGRLQSPEDWPEAPWDDARVFFYPDPRRGLGELCLGAFVDNRGEFSIDDVPPGRYRLLVRFLTANRYFTGSAFEVSPINEKLWRRPVDLGVVVPKKSERPPGAKREQR